MEGPEAVDWRVLGASVTGSKHLLIAAGCDDAHCYRILDNGSLIVAVADGAGSAPQGGAGARFAVAAACDLATDLSTDPPNTPAHWEKTLRETIVQVRRRLIDDVESTSVTDKPEGIGLGEFATTLLLVIAAHDTLAVAQIGDGFVVIQKGTEELHAVTLPEHGEYLNETSFLTSDDYLERLQLHVTPLESVTSIALLTDGLEMLGLDYKTMEPHLPFFLPLFAYAREAGANQEELEGFLSSSRVCERTDDDKTLALAVRDAKIAVGLFWGVG